MLDTMLYKGCTGSIEYSEEDKVFYGKILNIKDLVLFEGYCLEELEQAFQEMVDDYIQDFR
jgi:predicted HicB family RNase H-like nuclease